MRARERKNKESGRKEASFFLNLVAPNKQKTTKIIKVRLMLLAALAGEHLLLLGPPGTAKSELSRRMAKLVGGTYFERLLTRCDSVFLSPLSPLFFAPSHPFFLKKKTNKRKKLILKKKPTSSGSPSRRSSSGPCP